MREDKAQKLAATMQHIMRAMVELDIQYIELMQRLGVKNFTMHRF